MEKKKTESTKHIGGVFFFWFSFVIFLCFRVFVRDVAGIKAGCSGVVTQGRRKKGNIDAVRGVGGKRRKKQ